MIGMEHIVITKNESILFSIVSSQCSYNAKMITTLQRIGCLKFVAND